MSKTSKNPRTRGKSAPSIPPFLYKIYEILENPNYNDLASWNNEGDAFMIKNVTEFTEKVLPKYFKHNNFASFVRQLNLYGFHKSRYENNGSEFHHKLFRRVRALLCEIKRKTPNEEVTDSSSPFQTVPDEAESEGILQTTLPSPNSIQDLINRQDRLESAMKVVVVQNKQLVKDNKVLWNEVIKLKSKQSQTEKATRVINEQNVQLLKDNRSLWTELVRTREKHEKQVEKLMLILYSIISYSGSALIQKKNYKGTNFNPNSEENIQYESEASTNQDNKNTLSVLPVTKLTKGYSAKLLDSLFERFEHEGPNFFANIFEEDLPVKIGSLLELDSGKGNISSLAYPTEKRPMNLDYSFESEDFKTNTKMGNFNNDYREPTVLINQENNSNEKFEFFRTSSVEELTKKQFGENETSSPMHVELEDHKFENVHLKYEEHDEFLNIPGVFFSHFNQLHMENLNLGDDDKEEEKKDTRLGSERLLKGIHPLNQFDFDNKLSSAKLEEIAADFSPSEFLRRNSSHFEGVNNNQFSSPFKYNNGLDSSF